MSQSNEAPRTRRRASFSPPPRPERYERQATDDLPLDRPMTMAEVEERIVRADDELAKLTGIHMDLADQAAEAEADWKGHRDLIIQSIVDSSGERTASDYREAKARNSL